jgi:2-oxoglutarate ferredoxin oxidoreductase subunit beta
MNPMKPLDIDEFVGSDCQIHPHTLEEYETETPRWCKGCGDHGVLLAIQELLRDGQIDPENVVAVSGIGCSSRLPHYLRTYGFHGIHGRAFPISLGVKLARPELKVLTVMGDGDCFSIGAGHWVHTLRYNPHMMVVVLDNGVYALTKKQASPTSRKGEVTNTTPFGAYLRPLNPLSLILGISNVSFLAQTATWHPGHVEATLRRAWAHRGLSFVRILQRCPVYMPDLFGMGGQMGVSFLESQDGIPVERSTIRGAMVYPHDHRDLSAAQKMALMEEPEPLGLLYLNPDVPTYEDVRYSHVDPTDNPTLVKKLNAMLDRFAVQR